MPSLPCGPSIRRPDRPRRGVLAIAALTLATSASGVVVAPVAIASTVDLPCPTAPGPQTCSFADEVNVGRFTFPPGVHSVTATLRGGAGGKGADGPSLPVVAGSAGGAGGQVTVTVDRDPGTSVFLYVGSAGSPATSCASGGTGGTSGGISTGGGGGAPTGNHCAGGGGGGGSFITTAATLPNTQADLAQVLAAAGGGGGGGGVAIEATYGPGGAGGLATGVEPLSQNGSGIDANGGASGDRGGQGGTADSTSAGDGAPSRGGAGATGGGGGGSGYLGGGGGITGGGGGGGCGFPMPQETDTPCKPNTPSPTIERSGTFQGAEDPAPIVLDYVVPEVPVNKNPPGGPDVPPDPPGGPAGSNDPNPNTNPAADPEPLPGMDPATATARCRPSKGCSVKPPGGVDSQFQIDAAGGAERAVLFATTNGNFRGASLEEDAQPSGRPNCPGYVERNSDWVQFGFLQAKAGATWRKDAVMTQRQVLKTEAAAARLADAMQICFAAPYDFPVRRGYGVARSGIDRVGVLTDCASTPARAKKARPIPCVSAREVVRVKGGWSVRITFTVPANEQDPKALG